MPVVIDEAQPSELVHEEADARAGGADHFRKRLLTHFGDDRCGGAASSSHHSPQLCREYSRGSGSQRTPEARAPARPFGIGGVWIERFDLRSIQSVRNARRDAVRSVPPLGLDAAEAIALASARGPGRWRTGRGRATRPMPACRANLGWRRLAGHQCFPNVL